MKFTKKDIAKKWYEILGFKKEYDNEFYDALSKKEIVCDSIEDYDITSCDGLSNLIHILYFCEALKIRYEEKGICEEVLIDTLKDIPRWTDIYTKMKGSLYLGELNWLRNHFTMRLFKLGRLQFCFEDAHIDYKTANVGKGEKLIGIHIPASGPLDVTECQKSVEYARSFYSEFFPEYEYKIFNCHSWLLDGKLKSILDEKSNILKFRDMFEIISEEESYAIVKYVFTWDTTRENILEKEAVSSFAKKVKDAILSGETFHETIGIIKK